MQIQSKLGESGGAIRARPRPLAHTARVGAVHVGTKIRRFFAVMARIAGEPNGFWKTLALGLAGLVVIMLGWFLVDQAYQNREFRQESRTMWSDFERRLGRIENQLDDAG